MFADVAGDHATPEVINAAGRKPIIICTFLPARLGACAAAGAVIAAIAATPALIQMQVTSSLRFAQWQANIADAIMRQ
jgi:hypothetical protein